MRAVFLVGMTMLTLCEPVLAQQWIPPRPGLDGTDICSGWDTEEARQKCWNTEAAEKRRVDDKERAEQTRIKSTQDAVAARLRAERATKAEAEEQARDDAQRRQALIDDEAAIANEKARLAAAARAEAAKAAAAHREELLAKVRAQAAASAEAEAKAEARADAADRYKRADVLDAYVAPEKFLYTDIKIEALQCYAVRSEDYRCFTTGQQPVLVTAPVVLPDEEKALLEQQCGTIREAASPSCQRLVRFSVLNFETNTTPSGQHRVQFNAMAIRLAR